MLQNKAEHHQAGWRDPFNAHCDHIIQSDNSSADTKAICKLTRFIQRLGRVGLVLAQNHHPDPRPITPSLYYHGFIQTLALLPAN